MKNHLFNLLSLGILCLVLNLTASGAQEKYQVQLGCAEIDNGDTLRLFDPRYSSLFQSNWSDQFRYVSSHSYLKLKVEREEVTDNYSAYDYGIQAKITWDDDQLNIHVDTVDLFVTYDPTSGAIETKESAHLIGAAHKIEVEVLQQYGSPQSAPCNVYLEAEMRLDRIYAYDATLISRPAHQYDSASKELTIFWNDPSGAETYELEWVYVDDFSANGSSQRKSSADLNFDFDRDATRVRTPSTHYTLSLLYPSGYLLYRIRKVYREFDNDRQKLWSPWSSDATGTVNNHPNLVDLDTDLAHTNGINYGFERGFEENGRLVESAVYVDGLGREHQVLSKSGEEDNVMVGETYYDHYGRPALAVLPVPSGSPALGYYPLFNRDSSGNLLSKKDFDVDGTYVAGECDVPASPLSDEHGAARYYSPNNPDQEFQQAYLPDAEGYPYSRVQFLPDHTNRIVSENLPGAEYRVGNGRETIYEYSAGDAAKLDRIFGSQVGKAKNYYTTSIIDANGQLNSTVVDKNGKVIMKSLGGSTPGNLKTLSDTSARNDTLSLLSRNTEQKVYGPGNDTWTASQNVLATSGGQNQLEYKMLPGKITDACLPNNICLDCEYILTLSVTNSCGDEMIPGGPILDTISSPQDTTCQSDWFTRLDTLDLDEKKRYHVSKTLTVNPAAVDSMTEIFITHDTCLKTYADFLDEEIAMIDFSGCVTDICELGCLQELGARENAADTNQWDDDFAYCVDTCGFPDECTILYKNLLRDMAPGGQYGKFLNGIQLDASVHPLSIFNENNQLPGTVSWRTVTFKGADLVADSTYNRYGQYVPVNHSSIDFIDFYNNWQEEWTQDLVNYHPEYCYYTWCSGEKKSYEFDRDMTLLETYDRATTYMNPLYPLSSRLGWTANFVKDSFFLDPNAAGYPFRNYFATIVDSFITVGNSTYSMWEVAVITVHCPEDSTEAQYNTCLTNNSYGDSCYRDLHWRVFREFYYKEKKLLIDSLITDYAIRNECYNGCIGIDSATFNPADNSFNCYPIVKSPATCGGNYNGSSDPNQYCGDTYRGLYQSKNRRYDQVLDSLFGGQDSTYWANQRDTSYAVGKDSCKSNCEHLADYWMAQTSLCGLSASDSIDLRGQFIEICKIGCDSGEFTGVSTLPAGVTSSMGFSSFTDALDSFAILSDSCHTAFMDIPAPYEGDTLYINRSLFLDTCGCSAVLETRHTWNTGSYPNAEIADINELFYSLHGFQLYDFNYYACRCDEAFEMAGPSWTTGSYWSDTSTTWLRKQFISAPLELLCPKCISCEVFQNYVEELQEQGLSDTNSSNFYLALATLINREEDLQFPAGRYAEFHQGCTLAAGDTVAKCTDLNPAGEDLRRLLKQLIGTSFWGAYSGAKDFQTDTSLAWMNQSPLLPDTDYHHIWTCISWPDSLHQANCTDSTLRIYFGNDDFASCHIELTLADANAKGYGPEKAIAITRLYPADGTCDGTYDFVVEALFLTDTGIVTDTLTGVSSCVKIAEDCCSYTTLCDEYSTEDKEEEECYERLVSFARMDAMSSYNHYMDSLRKGLRAELLNECLVQAGDSESFDLYYPSNEYQHTLFYYDQAGNLLRTVPPKGVDNSGAASHSMGTEYRYNSFNLLTQQYTPDGGATYFWYDLAGRLIVSQDAAQSSAPGTSVEKYTYTLYDAHSRVIETGELQTTTLMSDSIAQNETFYDNWIGLGTKSQISKTFYDDALHVNIAARFKNGQNHLRNRVATSAYYPLAVANDTLYESATHYSYDAHGRVVETLNDITDLEDIDHNIKRTEYDFELISERVDAVHYQQGERDGFSQRYHYDEDNRLKEVETSRDGHIWQTDARYHYYTHGPLARVELGQDRVQGTDYLYTLQGWLKAVNSNTLQAKRDPGQDGSSDSTARNTGEHSWFAQDALGYSLGYYTDDYKAIGRDDIGEQGAAVASIDKSYGIGQGYHDLYNGNIGQMTTAIRDLDIHGNAYHYDQLNRIVSSEVYDNLNITDNRWVSGYGMRSYHSTYEYDANGNLTHLVRNGLDSLEARPVSYIDLTGISQLPDDNLIKVSVSAAGNAGAASAEKIEGDGYIEWITDSTMANNESIFVGLSYTNTNAHFNTIDYCWYYYLTTEYYIYEAGTAAKSGMTPTLGDTLRIERVDSTIYYYVNDSLMRSVAETNPGADLIVDISINTQGKTLGNIYLANTSLSGADTAALMDDLSYDYIYNRLTWLTETAPDNAAYDDIKIAPPSGGYNRHTYLYEANGNLKEDEGHNIDLIQWNIQNKPTRIDYLTGAYDKTEFTYSPDGMRRSKVNTTPGGDVFSTFYVYDASGQLLATYSREETGTSDDLLKLSEHLIYGSERLGSDPVPVKLLEKIAAQSVDTSYEAIDSLSYLAGYRSYELTNHLGNVLAVISDRKLPDSLGTAINQDVTWTSLTGVVVDSLGRLVKTAATAWNNAGASSEETLDGDGYLLWVIDADSSDNFNTNLGLSYTNTNHHYNTSDYAWHIDNGGNLYIYKSGSYVNAGYKARPYDELKIIRNHERITWAINDTLVHMINETSVGSSLLTDVALANHDNRVSRVSLHGWISDSAWVADVLMRSDYYPFGMQRPSRTFSSSSYRYAFNGMEHDIELKGEGNSYTTEYRQYDSRVGRWLSIDPLEAEFPWQSPYVAFDNNPIYYTDPDGLFAQRGGQNGPGRRGRGYNNNSNGNGRFVTGQGIPYQGLNSTRYRGRIAQDNVRSRRDFSLVQEARTKFEKAEFNKKVLPKIRNLIRPINENIEEHGQTASPKYSPDNIANLITRILSNSSTFRRYEHYEFSTNNLIYTKKIGSDYKFYTTPFGQQAQFELNVAEQEYWDDYYNKILGDMTWDEYLELPSLVRVSIENRVQGEMGPSPQQTMNMVIEEVILNSPELIEVDAPEYEFPPVIYQKEY